MEFKKKLLLLFIFLLTIVLAISYPFFYSFDTNLLNALNLEDQYDEVHTAFHKYEDDLSKQIVIIVSSKSFKEAKKVFDDIDKFFKKNNFLENIISHISTEDYQKAYQYYQRRKHYLLTPRQIQMIESGDASELEQGTLQKIYDPFNPLSSQFLVDPFFLFNEYYQQVNIQTKLILRNGVLISEENGVVNLFYKGKFKNAKDANTVFAYLKNLRKIKTVEVSFASMLFYGISAKKQALFESNTFSSISLVIICLLFFTFFRTLKHMLLSLIVIATCSVCGLFLTTFILGEIHIMALVLVISILGIISDYFIHYFMEELASQNKSELLGKIRKPLLFSAFTSVFGYGVFYFLTLPILKQFSLYSVITLSLAVLCVFFVLPFFYSPNKIVFTHTLNEKIGTKINIKALIIIPFLALALFLPKVLSQGIDNDIRTFANKDPLLWELESKVKEVLGTKYEFQQFLLRAKSIDELMVKEEKLKLQLKERGISGIFYSDWFPSKKHREESVRAYRKMLPMFQNFLQKFELNKNKMNGPNQELTQLSFDPLMINRDVGAQFLGKVGDSYYLITPIFNKTEKISFEELENDDQFFMSKVSQINDKLNEYSHFLIFGLFVTSVVLFIILGLYYSFKNSLQMIFPALSSCCVALAVSSFYAGGLGLFQILACILIIALGLDSSFFYYFNRGKSASVAYAVSLSTATTLASFGILFFSSTPIIKVFGLTLFVGVLFNWIVVPTVFKQKYLGEKDV